MCLQATLFFATAYAAIAKGNAGWNDDPTTQYHIQTDEGPERYFRYQTTNGQYRKEKRLEDGTVIGTYGWVDPTGLLLLRDYVADNAGYRIVRTKKVYVDPTNRLAGAGIKTAAPPLTIVTPAPPPVGPIKIYQTGNLYDHPHDSLVKPQAANFDSHPYFSSSPNAEEYTPVIGYQKKPTLYQKQSYQPILNNFQTPAVYQPAITYQKNYPDYKKVGAYGDKVVQTVRVYTPKQQAYIEQQEQLKNYQTYDGVSTTQNGFRYYLPRHYHEEESSPSNDRAGSFGYIDPFGIRRVIYYNSSPATGFQVKKNNRYVGFNSTPYDPRV